MNRDAEATEPAPSNPGFSAFLPLLLVGGMLLLSALTALAIWRPWTTGGYEVEAELFRTQGESRETLREGATLAEGDQLALRFEATKELWVYVVEENSDGRRFLLFPVPGLDRSNPVKADEEIFLPGTRDGEARHWVIEGEPGGRTFGIIASPRRVPQMERELRRMSAPVEGVPIHYAELGSDSDVVLRGLGGIGGKQRLGGGTLGEGRVWAELPALVEGPEKAQGLWVRKIELGGSH